jgi:hypothetical protein
MRYDWRMRRSCCLPEFGAWAATVLATACGGLTATPPAQNDDAASSVDSGGTMDSAGMVDAGGTTGDASDEEAPSTCGNVTNAAPMIETTKQAADPPTLSGGTITPGTYFVSAVTTYTGIGGESGATGVFESDTLVLTSTTYAEALDIDEPDAGPPTRFAVGGMYSAADAMLTFDVQCPMMGTSGFPYSAEGNVLTVLSRGTTSTDVYVYSGQF